MYLALTATCREHRAFLVESATREEQQRVNRAQRLEIEGDRRSNAEEGMPRRFERRRLPVQHDERRCLGVPSCSAARAGFRTDSKQMSHIN
ncbi:hypothetical protein ABFA07_005535 [Porites harrisoni]